MPRKYEFIDLTGQIFGEWTVLRRAESNGKSQTYWICRCVCDVERAVSGGSLRDGKSTNCGCRRNLKNKLRLRKKNGRPRLRVLANAPSYGSIEDLEDISY